MDEAVSLVTLMNQLGIPPIVAVAIGTLAAAFIWFARNTNKTLKGIEEAILKHGLILQGMVNDKEIEREHDAKVDDALKTLSEVVREIAFRKYNA